MSYLLLPRYINLTISIQTIRKLRSHALICAISKTQHYNTCNQITVITDLIEIPKFSTNTLLRMRYDTLGFTHSRTRAFGFTDRAWPKALENYAHKNLTGHSQGPKKYIWWSSILDQPISSLFTRVRIPSANFRNIFFFRSNKTIP